MSRRIVLSVFALGAPAAVAAHVMAQEYGGQIAARHGEMNLLSTHLGVIGDMAKGERTYDAEMATSAAENLVAISNIRQDFLWPEGSDNGHADGTDALPAIWESYDDFLSHWSDLNAAATELASVAGDGQSALGPALGPVGDACSGCHEDYRAEN